MYNFRFTYSGGHYRDYAHISKVEFHSDSGLKSIFGNDILSQDYPLNYDLHLISELQSYKVPHNCLKSIKVTKEEN